MFITEIAAFLFPNHFNNTSNITFGFFLEFNLLNLQFAYWEQKAGDASNWRHLWAFSVDPQEPARKVQPRRAGCPRRLLSVRSLALLLAVPSTSFLDWSDLAGWSTKRCAHKPGYWSPSLFPSVVETFPRGSPRFLRGRISQQAKRCRGSEWVPHLWQIFIKVAGLGSFVPSVFSKRGKRWAARVCGVCVCVSARAHLPLSLFRPPGIAPV